VDEAVAENTGMTRSAHERAQELITLGESLGDAHETWLQAHLEECADCRDYAEAAGRVVRALRSRPLAAGSALVRSTQMRVRSRALELERRQERQWVICVCCVAVAVSTSFTT